ncbi:hypothetical protein LCGC14_1123920 [marine sediment metagenome]|uniref:Uncharacterized protein n=1 Tax=marine sediment metagenome TaxID=412755 RepID=A0A0F9M375_9ZZZZ
MLTLSPDLKTEILKLFREMFTVNQIAEKTNVDRKEILLFLTKEGHWSKACSSCVIKDCYNCKGLEEFGKTISIQDRIDFIARVKNAKN